MIDDYKSLAELKQIHAVDPLAEAKKFLQAKGITQPKAVINLKKKNCYTVRATGYKQLTPA